ncbi:hypothetical protein [Rhodococcus triatomae]|nr:hypothetical protein G419_07949 [Rhodococcus triatomae BKS 15-14]
MNSSTDEVASRLVDRAGTTYAEDSGITMRNRPMPLFQLLVLALLLSTRISADLAVRAARELYHAGIRTPEAAATADRRSVIAALGRAHYRRYDESTATRLREMGETVRDRYRGDLRKLAERSDGDIGAATALLTEFTGIGEVGASIFLREVQDVWPWVRPYLDERALRSADDLGLPTEPADLAALAPGGDVAPLAAALVRASLDSELRTEIVDAPPQ